MIRLLRPWRDTLFRRLFLLMLVAIVGSHLVAYLVVTQVVLPALNASVDATEDAPGVRTRPGIVGDWDDAAARADPAEPHRLLPPEDRARDRERGPGLRLPRLGTLPPTPGVPSIDRPRGQPQPVLPLPALLADYAIRIGLMALAAWWGSRWLTRPVQRMVDSAQSLGEGLAQGHAPAPLDEHMGTVEVREAAQVFNRMADRLVRAFRGRGVLVASISHDLRTPLTRMRIRLEGLLPDARAAKCIDDVREMNALVDAAIEVFRADSADGEPLQTLDVHALLQSMLDDLAETGQQVPLHGQRLLARARPEGLRRALDNLVANALRHGRDAEVRVLNDGGPLIRVEDRGPGIAPEDLERVLEPFTRLDPSRSRQTGGAGLGLHIAQSLLQAQGGSLQLSAREGGGLRVDVRLQAAPEG